MTGIQKQRKHTAVIPKMRRDLGLNTKQQELKIRGLEYYSKNAKHIGYKSA